MPRVTTWVEIPGCMSTTSVFGIWIILTTSSSTRPLAWPFRSCSALEGAAEILLEYDSGAVEGVEDLDQTYSLRIGYRW